MERYWDESVNSFDESDCAVTAPASSAIPCSAIINCALRFSTAESSVTLSI